MTTHLTRDQLQDYESGAMAASALLEADRHLAECATCRQLLRQSMPAPRLPELVQQMAEPLHLTYEQMAGFLDTSLEPSAQQWIEQHSAICRRCASELAELQAFDKRIAAEMESAVLAQPAPQPWLQRLQLAMRQYFAAPQRLRFAAAGVGLMALGFFSLLQAAPAGPGKGYQALANVSALVFSTSTPMHPQLFYGGFVVAACGAAVLLYALLRR